MANSKERIDALEAQMTDMCKSDHHAPGILKQFSFCLDALEENLEATDNARNADSMDWESKFQDLQDRVELLSQAVVNILAGGMEHSLRPRVPEPKSYGGARDAKELEKFLFDNPEEDLSGEKPKDTPPKKKGDVPGKGLMYVDIKVNRKATRAMVDTGAIHNYIYGTEVERVGLTLEKGCGRVKAISSAAQPVAGIDRSVLIKVGPNKGRTNFSVVTMDDFKLILGLEFLRDTDKETSEDDDVSQLCFMANDDHSDKNGGLVTFGDNSNGKIIGKGKIGTGSISIDNVSLVDGLKFNLISISQLINSGHKVQFEGDQCLISHALDGGHVHIDLIKKLLSKELVRGLPKLKFFKDKVCDACQYGCLVDCKSTSGTCQFLGDALVSWHSKKQTYVALSTAESEYVAVGSCCAQARWQELLAEFNLKLEYMGGSTNSVGDALNRRAELDQLALTAMDAIFRIDSRVAINIGKKIKKALTKDSVAQQLLKLVESGKTRQFWEEDGLLMTKGRRAYVLRVDDLRRTLTRECHDTL
ncbi:hypothetical protein RJ640_003404 [Escallonia rubra]|uniref:Uncharacterized protein n=1 Tax=Escallonia rubra TaxID=112253 RepID=A0AA88RXN8_9ASTE|nr:hypothetical protein RJ640_003404 [Escallonia rubra]